MKKRLLVGLSVAIGFASIAQNSRVIPNKFIPQAQPSMMNLKMKIQPEENNDEGFVPQAPYAYNYNPTVTARTIALSPTEQEIGFTYYGSQTNRSLINRTQLGSDGSITGVWTFTSTNPIVNAMLPDRGTGYQYAPQGGSFSSPIPSGPSTRVENIRTGFGSYTASEAGTRHEAIVSHESGKLHVATRSTAGSGTWTDQSLNFPDIWATAAYGGANNSTIHFVARTKNAVPPDTKTPKVFGQLGAITYYRSQDNGASWDIQQLVIPDIDYNNYIGFSANVYAIDARGDVVAIVAGGPDKDFILLKSIDNGDTWTKTKILPFPIDFYNDTINTTDVDGDGIAERITTTGGAYSVILDQNNTAHVGFEINEIRCDTAFQNEVRPGSAGTFTILRNGVAYWNDLNPDSLRLPGFAQDLNGDTTINIPPHNKRFGFGYYGSFSLASHPSLGLDANDNIYMAFSAVKEGTFYKTNTSVVDSGQMYRHTFVVKSLDGGNTWGLPLDIIDSTQNQNVEAVFGSMAKKVDGYCHIVYQKDTIPGVRVTTPIQASSTTAESLDNDNFGQVSHIIYTKIDVNDIPVFDPLTGIKNAPKSKDTGKVSVYPNPATSAAQVIITLTKSSNVAVSVFNSMGAEVAKFDNTSKSAGVSKLNIDVSHLTSGIYFIKTQIDNEISTTKLVVR